MTKIFKVSWAGVCKMGCRTQDSEERPKEKYTMNHFKMLRYKHVMTTIFVVIFLWSCAYQPGSLENPERGFNLVSQSMEIQMGMEAAREVESEMKIMNDPQIQNYISSLGQRLVQYSRRPDIGYQFKVVDTDEINAFALPGGFIYINRGLIQEAESEAELAGVVGHEIGHVVARHGAKRMSKLIALQIGFTVFEAMSDRDRQTQIQLLLAQALATGYLLKNSRDSERQADDLGAENLYRAGYEPLAMAQFFDKLGHGSNPGAIDTFFSTHPNPGERIRNVEALIATFPPKPYITDTPEFQRIKQMLASKSSTGRSNRQQRARPRQRAIGNSRRR
jgi:predicted Zn-dependent protease